MQVYTCGFFLKNVLIESNKFPPILSYVKVGRFEPNDCVNQLQKQQSKYDGFLLGSGTSYVLYPNLCSIVFVIPINHKQCSAIGKEYNRSYIVPEILMDNTPIQANLF